MKSKHSKKLVTVSQTAAMAIDDQSNVTSVRGSGAAPAASASSGSKRSSSATSSVLVLPAPKKGPLALAFAKPANDQFGKAQALFFATNHIAYKDFIQPTFPQTVAFWSELEAIITFLTPFQTATDVLQKDSATLNHVWEQFKVLEKHIKNSEAAFGKSVCKRGGAALKQRWNAQVNRPATVACTMLSLDVDLENLEQTEKEAAKEFIVQFGTAYIRFYNLSSLGDELEGELQRQVTSFVGRRGRFDKLAELIARAKTVDEFDPFDVWDMYSIELAVVAKALLSITASEAAVERSFSAQDAVHTKKRNRLLDTAVQQEMFVKFNTRALNREQHFQLHSATIELSPDADDFPSSDSDADADSELEDNAEEQKEDAVDDGAAAAAAPSRSASEMDAALRAFLEAYIDEKGITLANYKRWNGDRTNAIERALLLRGKGSLTTSDCIGFIKDIIEEQNREH
jgi:hypothetical protein